jgi:hypothetical protein
MKFLSFHFPSTPQSIKTPSDNRFSYNEIHFVPIPLHPSEHQDTLGQTVFVQPKLFRSSPPPPLRAFTPFLRFHRWEPSNAPRLNHLCCGPYQH